MRSQRATDLTHQLLAFSKRGALVKKAASIAAWITDSATFTTRGSNVLCTFEIEEPLWASEVDVGQISQVIQTLARSCPAMAGYSSSITSTHGLEAAVPATATPTVPVRSAGTSGGSMSW